MFGGADLVLGDVLAGMRLVHARDRAERTGRSLAAECTRLAEPLEGSKACVVCVCALCLASFLFFLACFLPVNMHICKCIMHG